MNWFKIVGSILVVGLCVGMSASCQQQPSETAIKKGQMPKNGWEEPPLHSPGSITGSVSISGTTVTLTYTITCDDPNDTVQCFSILYNAQDFSIVKGYATANLCGLIVNSTVNFTCSSEISNTWVGVTPNCNIPEKGLLIQAPSAPMGFVLCPTV